MPTPKFHRSLLQGWPVCNSPGGVVSGSCPRSSREYEVGLQAGPDFA